MIKTLRILFFTVIFSGVLLTSFADRGLGKKKNNVVLNIKMPSTFRSSLNFNLRNGLKYNGSLVNVNKSSVQTSTGTTNTLITYQKGNSIYILPYKQKVFVSDAKQGFAGTKLVIRLR
jgi:hypothetical protein